MRKEEKMKIDELYQRGELVAEGKTKRIWTVRIAPSKVRVHSKDDVTAFDDKRFTSIMPDKAVLSTATTCRVFELLRAAGLPVAFSQQLADTEFLAQKARMILLEVIARRLVGPKSSYVARYPHLAEGRTDENPFRFHRLKIEPFLKTTKGKLVINGKTVLEGLNPEKGEEDPLITNPYDAVWKLAHSKRPVGSPESDLKKTVQRDLIISKQHLSYTMDLTRKTFLVIEGAFNILGFRLADLKIEVGIDALEELVIADVIDNDSWRLTDYAWNEYSKQFYRDLIKGRPKDMGLSEEEMREVARRYRLVAELTAKFRLPKQALVIWTGSPNDEIISTTEDINLSFPGVALEKVVKSGHKQSRAVADEIDRLETQYPDGGVIIVYVRRSNGLGPTLASRTTWPVISVPADLEKHPEDIWSSVRLASKDPHLTAWPFENALRAALNHLAQKNPAVYMARQMEIEELDI